MKRFVLIIFVLCVFAAASAQKPVRVCGEYTFSSDSKDLTQAQAEQIALQRARNAALTAEFNQTVYQSNTTVVTNRDGESTVDLYSVGGSDLRGEWIEDIGEPSFETTYEQGMLMVKATVCGMAREIVSAGINVELRVLRNGKEPKFESDRFNSGDVLYLWFRAPVDGYVTAWLLDRSNQTVYCLLPDVHSSHGAEPVNRNKEYLFFDFGNGDWNYTMECEREVEYNDLYLVFSPNSYSRMPEVEATADNMLQTISFKQFSEWITRCRTKDRDMVVEQRLIEIHKKKE